MRPTRAILLVLVVLAVLQAVVYFPRMPETMATHFDARGEADGWSSRSTFFALTLGIVALLSVTLGRPAIVLSRPRWVSIPHRDYWMAPERRQATLRTLGDQLNVFAIATIMLMLVITQMVITANQREVPVLSSWVPWIVTAYLIAAIAWAVYIVWYFCRKPESR